MDTDPHWLRMEFPRRGETLNRRRSPIRPHHLNLAAAVVGVAGLVGLYLLITR